MKSFPPEFYQHVEEMVRIASTIEGQLTPREIRFLALLAATPVCPGEVLEIGSFKGRSTMVLAKSVGFAGQQRITAVDPLDSPSVTDPSLGGQVSAWQDFQANLKRTGVWQQIEFHQERSSVLASRWNQQRPIRLLWIDGDHTYSGTKQDFVSFSPFLADGAIVALHDVLHHHGGPARVFAEDILLSKHFGPAGVCGSIGWSQYCASDRVFPQYHAAKVKLYRRVQRLIAYAAFGGDIEGWAKLGYKLARAGIPHGSIKPATWLKEIQFKPLSTCHGAGSAPGR